MRKLLPLLSLLLLSQSASAAPIIYDVNEMFGGAKAVGTITTDGKIGALSATDIIGFNLFLNNGSGNTSTINFSSGMVVFNGQLDVEASASTLQFVSGPGASTFRLTNTAGTSTFSFSDDFGSASETVNVNPRGLTTLVNSPHIFGVAEPAVVPGALPEPASFALLGLGLAALVIARRKRTTH